MFFRLFIALASRRYFESQLNKAGFRKVCGVPWPFFQKFFVFQYGYENSATKLSYESAIELISTQFSKIKDHRAANTAIYHIKKFYDNIYHIKQNQI